MSTSQYLVLSKGLQLRLDDGNRPHPTALWLVVSVRSFVVSFVRCVVRSFAKIGEIGQGFPGISGRRLNWFRTGRQGGTEEGRAARRSVRCSRCKPWVLSRAFSAEGKTRQTVGRGNVNVTTLMDQVPLRHDDALSLMTEECPVYRREECSFVDRRCTRGDATLHGGDDESNETAGNSGEDVRVEPVVSMELAVLRPTSMNSNGEQKNSNGMSSFNDLSSFNGISSFNRMLSSYPV